jgi:hypothetical protein
MTLYLLPASFVFVACTKAFMKDSSAPKDDIGAWLFIAFASLLWPVSILPVLLNWSTQVDA